MSYQQQPSSLVQGEGEQIFCAKEDIAGCLISGGDSDDNNNNPNVAGFNYKRHDKNEDGTDYIVALEDQEDVISMWQEYDAERDLLEKLGLQPYRYEQKKREVMDQQEKHDFDENVKANKEYKRLADEIIAIATKEADDMKIECEKAQAQVEQLKISNDLMRTDLEKQKGRDKEIEEDFKDKIQLMRTRQLGEIYWTMQAANDPNDQTDKDTYVVAIDNYLLTLYLEDNDEEYLEKADAKYRQKQIYDHFKKCFKELVKKKIPKAMNYSPEKRAELFKELFPKPEASDDEKAVYEECIKAYEEHINATYGDIDGNFAGVLDEPSVDGSSNEGSSMTKVGSTVDGVSQAGEDGTQVEPNVDPQQLPEGAGAIGEVDEKVEEEKK